MIKGYTKEISNAIYNEIQRLQDIVGYHFVWCDAYLKDPPNHCNCGMRKLMEAKSFLKEVTFNELSS